VLVYLGAVMVLFLFVLMMLDIHIDSLRQGFWRHFPLALAIGALITLEMAVVLFGGFRTGDAPVVPETVTNAGRPSRAVLEHQGPWHAAVHALPLPDRDRGGAAADGDDRGHRAHPARAQGQQEHRPGLQVRVKARPPEVVKMAPTQAPLPASRQAAPGGGKA
jgi:hypothetical protein